MCGKWMKRKEEVPWPQRQAEPACWCYVRARVSARPLSQLSWLVGGQWEEPEKDLFNYGLYQ